jgi:hypothetical protein
MWRADGHVRAPGHCPKVDLWQLHFVGSPRPPLSGRFNEDRSNERPYCMIAIKQLDLSFGGRRNIRVRRPKHVSPPRAEWWFQRMREAVECSAASVMVPGGSDPRSR